MEVCAMTVLDLFRKKIIDEVEKIGSQARKMADYIFDNPELGKKEFKAQKYLADELKRNGFMVENGIGSMPTAFRAEYNLKKPGPAVAFIAEYDALPQMGHACHHHIIASASVNAAIALSKLKKQLCGKIVVMGTPAEEGMGAKGVMSRNGAFKGLDVGLMFHGGSKNTTALVVLAVEGFEFTYKGKASHAASAPYEGVNALDAVIMLFTSINALRQQLKEDVRIHGNITKGGDAVNIIPETASAQFYIRAQQRKYLNEVVEKVKNCAKGAALQTGAELTISVFEDPGNDLLKNIKLVEEFERNFRSLGGEIDNEPYLLGSSDIGNLSYEMPVIHPMVKTADNGLTLHTREFLKCGKTDIAYEGMMLGMKSIALTGARVMLDPEFLKAVKKEFEASTKGL
jgi:amidohydrolase